MYSRIKEARRHSDLTQRQAAEKANIGERQYQDYEYGKREPGVRTAIRIADALNITVPDEFRNLWFDDSPG